MKFLHNLIRLAKWRLDERRQAVADLEGERRQLLDGIAELEARSDEESRVAAAAGDVLFVFPAYRAAQVAKVAALEESVSDVDDRLEEAHEALRGAFREVKKLELSLEAHQRRAQAEADRRDQIALDEMALDGFRRRPANN